MKSVFFALVFCLLVCAKTVSGQEMVLGTSEVDEIVITNSVILHSISDRRGIFKMVSAEKWRNYLPRVGISYFGLNNTNVNQPDSQYNDVRLQLNQLVYDGGENFLEIESAKLQDLLNNQDWNITKNKITFEAQKSYLKLIANSFKYSMILKSFDRIRQLKVDSDLGSEKGFNTELDRMEAESKIRELELSALKSLSSIKLAEIELKRQLNLPIETSIVTKDSLLEDFIIFEPIELGNISDFLLNKPELKKSKLAIENIRTRQEILDSYWKPKVVLGGYYGQNINGALPVKNEVYGFNIGLQTQLGSSTNQTSLNSGIQTDGTGIQRIPGFGPQFVGRGENAYNSTNFNLFDDLSYSRKIYEGQIALSDAIRNKRALEINLEAEIYKTLEKVKENWQIIRLSNAKFYQSAEAWKSAVMKYDRGFIKISEYLAFESELLRSLDDLSQGYIAYLEASYELAFHLGVAREDLSFVRREKSKGNSIFNELLKLGYFDLTSNIDKK
ncbi:TolC family protein [Leptospira sp. 96542]|nr:TolC family protein [Leptospira sp. 96542]